MKFCADSYFSSFPGVSEIGKIGPQFVSVVNTDEKQYPMPILNINYLHEHGDYKKMLRINEYYDSVYAVAIMWLDKIRQFFVGNAEPATTKDPLNCVRRSPV